MLLESQVHITRGVDELDLLGIQLVLLDVMGIVVEGITKSVDLGLDFVLNLALAVDGPQLAELASQFEVYTASDEGIATGLMHCANAVNVEVLGHGLETAREVQLPLDLLAVVIVHEVSV